VGARFTITTIVGARPQFIKAATVSRVINKSNNIREILIHTGQHYDHNISGVFFEEMEIRNPDFHLGIGSGPHGQQTGKMLEGIEAVLMKEPPDIVLVYGDTNSTLAGALAAVKLHIPVAHVEAGLRSFNRAMPEEINRVVTDHVSASLFAPTEIARANLRREGIAEHAIVKTGDVMYDAALYYAARAEIESTIIRRLEILPGEFILATVHRAENTDKIETLRSILMALASVSAAIPVVLPLHPRTLAVVTKYPELSSFVSRLKVIEPIGYFDMITLERSARLIVTDSGGVQKEASFHNVRCVTLRAETEWVELIGAGRNTLAPPELGPAAVEAAIRSALDAPQLGPADIYGDGHAAEAIVSSILSRYP
jgi:UDP-GlcNAc3NAcA epimerase